MPEEFVDPLDALAISPDLGCMAIDRLLVTPWMLERYLALLECGRRLNRVRPSLRKRDNDGHDPIGTKKLESLVRYGASAAYRKDLVSAKDLSMLLEDPEALLSLSQSLFQEKRSFLQRLWRKSLKRIRDLDPGANGLISPGRFPDPHESPAWYRARETGFLGDQQEDAGTPPPPGSGPEEGR